MTPEEARQFLRLTPGDLPVTWGITPSGSFRIWLLSVRRLKRTLRRSGFLLRQLYGANAISGLVPLPVQQESDSKLIEAFVKGLIYVDRVVGRIPPFRTFAGNVFMLCEVNPKAAE